MIYRRYIGVILIIFLIVVLVLNIYFVCLIDTNSDLSNKKNYKQNKTKITAQTTMEFVPPKNTISLFHEKIRIIRNSLSSKYFKQNSSYINLLKKLLIELKVINNTTNVVDRFKTWPHARYLTPDSAPELGTTIELLRNSNIIKADNAKVGTQLKLMLTFENGLKGLFKPQWYSRNTKLQGPVYYGKERHNAEIVAYHLSSILFLRRVPLSFIKKIDLLEMKKYASPALLNTMFKKGNTTCFYGVCHYCTPSDYVCGMNNILEGSLTMWLPPAFQLEKFRNPWQRTYIKNKLAAWESGMTFCDKFSNRLLDLIDTAIFDFLMDNGDRHHYELLKGNFENPAILFIDNGKSLGNPDVDHLDILAPLYQCCVIYKETWNQLQLLSGGILSIILKQLLNNEKLMAKVLPIMDDQHFEAMNRRLLTIYSVVEYCLQSNKYSSSVLIDR